MTQQYYTPEQARTYTKGAILGESEILRRGRSQQYYTLAEANIHWKNTIAQGRLELERKIEKDILTTARYETISITK